MANRFLQMEDCSQPYTNSILMIVKICAWVNKFFFVVVNGLCSFQIYGMPVYDDMESLYTKRMKKPCPWWLRTIFRVFFGFLCFFIAVAIPFCQALFYFQVN